MVVVAGGVVVDFVGRFGAGEVVDVAFAAASVVAFVVAFAVT